MSEVSFVKMKSGEEYVATVTENETCCEVFNPVILQQQKGADGQVQSVFIPWCAFSKSREFVIDSDDILFVTEATDNISQAYSEAYSQSYSQIITPNKPQIITG